MGRLKELREKLAKGDITEEEKSELAELESDIAETKDESEDASKMVDDLAEELAQKTFEKLEAKQKSEKKEEKKETTETKVTEVKSARFIVDKELGEVSVDKLETMTLELPNRENKKHKEISMKSAHVIAAMVTGDVQKLQVLVEGTGARGGFLVPDDYRDVLYEDIRDISVMRQLADVFQTDSDTVHVPSLASRPQARFRSEGAVKFTSTADFAENILTPYSLASIVPLSNELVRHAKLGVNGNIVGKITQLLTTALNERAERAYWTGSGSGEPTGFNTYTFRTVAAGAGASDSAKADAVIKAWHRLPQGYRNRAVWVAHSQTWEKIGTLKDSQNNYLLSSLANGPTMTLRGRPIYEQNDLPAGELFLGDFSYYVIADSMDIEVAVSEEATVGGQSAFERNLTFVRAEMATDGELTLTSPFVEVTGIGTP